MVFPFSLPVLPPEKGKCKVLFQMCSDSGRKRYFVSRMGNWVLARAGNEISFPEWGIGLKLLGSNSRRKRNFVSRMGDWAQVIGLRLAQERQRKSKQIIRCIFHFPPSRLTRVPPEKGKIKSSFPFCPENPPRRER